MVMQTNTEEIDVEREGAEIFKNPVWNPVSWHPVYEQIVILSASGWTNIKLAKEFNYTPQHICNILKTEEAKDLRHKILEKMRAEAVANIPDRLQKLTNAALDIAEEIMITRKDELIQDSPFKMLDRSLAMLRGVGKLSPETQVNQNQQNNFFITDSQTERLEAGMAKLQEVWKRHGTPIEPKVVAALKGGDPESTAEVIEDNDNGKGNTK